jgi:hypothetical protein
MLLLIFQCGAVYFDHMLGAGVQKETHFARLVPVLACYFTVRTSRAPPQR